MLCRMRNPAGEYATFCYRKMSRQLIIISVYNIVCRLTFSLHWPCIYTSHLCNKKLLPQSRGQLSKLTLCTSHFCQHYHTSTIVHTESVPYMAKCINWLRASIYSRLFPGATKFLLGKYKRTLYITAFYAWNALWLKWILVLIWNTCIDLN